MASLTAVVSALTSGSDGNETTTRYSHNGMSHDIRILAQISPEIILLHQMRMTGFYKKTRADKVLPTIERGMRVHMFRDING